MCPISLTYVSGSNSEDEYVENNKTVLSPLVIICKNNARKQISVNVSVIGALKYILSFLMPLLYCTKT